MWNRQCGEIWFLFLSSSLLVSAKFLFLGKTDSSFLISYDPKCEVVRQLVYTMFITNNRVSLRLWWNEDLVKYQKNSKRKFEGVWSELEVRSCFQRQSCTEYLGQTLVVVGNWHCGRILLSISPRFFPWCWRGYREGWALGYNSIKSWDFTNFS